MTSEKKGGKERTCQYEMMYEEPCRRKLYDSEHCIFHSKSIEGKRYFKDEFWKEFERQKKNKKEYDFTGFVFPVDISFEEIKFEKYVSFFEAQFSGNADFSDTEFSGLASFLFTQFAGNAIFGDAKFSKAVGFDDTQFAGNAIFNRATFSGEARFFNTQFFGKVYFNRTQFSGEANFINAEFHSNSFFHEVKFEDFNQCYMNDTSFYNVFDLLEYIEKNRNKIKRSKGIKYLHDNCKPILGEATVSRLPLLSREIKDDVYLLSFKEKHPKIHFIWWFFADCGRSFLRWAVWSLIFALLFGLIYTPCFDFLPRWWIDLCNIIGPQFEQTSEAFSGHPPGFWSSLYFSIVTFTTLGFGDIVAANITARILVTLEVILGYIMLGGLISIFANKLARRS